MSLSKAEHRISLPEVIPQQPSLSALLRRAVPALYEEERYEPVRTREQFLHSLRGEYTKPGLDGSPSISPAEWQQIEAACDMTETAHEGQLRGNGDRYITHPYTVTKRFVDTYGVGWKQAIALLMHDVPEDTNILLEEIQKRFGDYAGIFLHYLTKVRTPDGKTDKIKTFLKHVSAMLEMPEAAAGKVFDSLNNEETADGIPEEKKRVAKAIEWMQVGGALAEIEGLTPEAQMIADLGYVVLEHSAGRGAQVKQMLDLRDQYYGGIDAQQIVDRIQMFKANSDILSIEIRQPGIYELASGMKDVYHPTREDFPLSVVVTIPDKSPHDDLYMADYQQEGADVGVQHALGVRANIAVSTLLGSRSFIPPLGNEVGFINAAEQGPTALVPKMEYRLRFQQSPDDADPIPLQLTVYREEDRDLETTPLTYLPGIARRLSIYDQQRYGAERKDMFKKRQRLAQEKWRRIGVLVDQLSASVQSDEELAAAFFKTIPDSKMIIGKKETGERVERPVPATATVLDYILLVAPESFPEVSSVNINGQGVTDYQYVLNQGDVIELIFHRDTYHITPAWLDAIGSDDLQETSRSKIRESLLLQKRTLEDRLYFLDRNRGVHPPYGEEYDQRKRDYDTLCTQIHMRGIQRLLDHIPELQKLNFFGYNFKDMIHQWVLATPTTRDLVEQLGVDALPPTAAAQRMREALTTSMPQVLAAMMPTGNLLQGGALFSGSGPDMTTMIQSVLKDQQGLLLSLIPQLLPETPPPTETEEI